MVTFNSTGISGKQQNPEIVDIVSSAIKAPSGHNTQPWIFRHFESSVEIHPDFSRSLPVVDGNHRELYISLGCAAENFCIAAREFGYLVKFSIEMDENSHAYIKLDLDKCECTKDPLYEQIGKRQTNRSVYKQNIIPREKIVELQNIELHRGITLRIFEKGSPGFETLKDMVVKGNEIQMNDPAFKAELLSWIRFNKKHVRENNNGLTYEVMGTPATPVFIGKLVVKSFLTPKNQNKTDIEKINSSSHLVLFSIEQNNPENWVLLGMNLQRFLLETTRLGIASAYLNQPCEVESVSVELQSQLSLKNETPALLLRIGYANPLPYSPRKDVSEVIRVDVSDTSS